MARITSIKIQGYRPFVDFLARFSPLEVLVGANGSGKSALFEFLMFLRDSVQQEIPPQIIRGAVGQQIFNVSGDESFRWNVVVDDRISYQGELLGPVGQIQVISEQVASIPKGNGEPFVFLERSSVKGGMTYEPDGEDVQQQGFVFGKPNQLALNVTTNAEMETVYSLREYMLNWRFYSGFNIANHKIRRSVPVEQEPFLHEDAGNLSTVLHYLMTEHRRTFEDLERIIRGVVPGFEYLTVKARGGPGEVIAFWKEKGLDQELSVADLSDGILRLLCWTVLCLHPNPPTLICIDEPDQGVHPRTLPVLAGLFEKASQRTQILLATHDSYFLKQFDLAQIAVMRKENGEARFIKPGDSQVLVDILEDFGADEIENLYRSDELERLP